MGARRLVRGAREQIACRITTAAFSPRRHHVIVFAVVRRPQRLDAFGRAVNAKLDRGGVGAGQIRVVWVDEEPRGLGFTAGGFAQHHQLGGRWRLGGGG